MDDQELYDEIIDVMTRYGSDAQERQEPGSKLKAQAERIVAFVEQRNRAFELLRINGLNLVRIVRR